MLISAAAIFIGLLALFWGADRFVVGAGATARNLGVSPGLIGLVIVGFATSPPEMLVSAVASLDDAAGLAAGNALGSKLANLGLVPGTAILSFPSRSTQSRCIIGDGHADAGRCLPRVQSQAKGSIDSTDRWRAIGRVPDSTRASSSGNP